MSRILDGLSRLLSGRSADTKASAVGPLIAWEPLGQPVWAPRDYAAFAREGFMQNAIVYRSVRMIAEAAASVPLLLYEGEDEIAEHPLIDLIARPSPDQTAADLLEAWYGYLLVAGNAYVEAVALSGRLRELHVLRPDRMKVIPGPDGWPEAFEYSASGRSVHFAAEPVAGVRPILHVRLFHPVNDHYGMSPIEAAAKAIDIHNAAGSWNKALLDNAARPSGALVYAAASGNLTGEQFARLRRELEEGFQGARNAGRPLLLEGGLDWKPLSLSPKDMDFVEAKHASAREIALALGVPPMLLGIPGDNTYSNYQEAQRAFWRATVLPLVNRMTKAFSGWLAPAWGGRVALRPDLDQVEGLSAEREALWARLNAATFLTVNEKRAAVGYGPVDVAAPGTTPEAKAGSDPGQPRVPEGNEDGGQWTDGGGGSGGGNSSRNRGGSEQQRVQVAGRAKVVRELVKRLIGSKPKFPEFLTKRPTTGKITGKVEDLTDAEKRFVEELKDLGNDVEIVPRGAGRTPDLKINGKPHELKAVDGVKSTETDALSNAISNRILNARGQAADVIVDARKQPGMTREAAERAVRRAYGADFRRGIDSITILTPDGPIYVPRR
jgi:HK97 family phage portal protein